MQPFYCVDFIKNRPRKACFIYLNHQIMSGFLTQTLDLVRESYGYVNLCE